MKFQKGLKKRVSQKKFHKIVKNGSQIIPKETSLSQILKILQKTFQKS